MPTVQPRSEFTIREYEHGILIIGPVPVNSFHALTVMAKERGFDLIDAGIASALKGTMALVSKTSGAKWRAEIEAGIQHDGADSPLRWLAGTDTGVSSKSLCWALTGEPKHLPYDSLDAPYDDDDFGRCSRFLARFPHLREKLPEAATKLGGRWPALIARWDELERLHAAKEHRKVSALIDSLYRVRA